MGYTNLQQCVEDLEAQGELIRIEKSLDPHLEIGAVQRRVFRAGGPALLFTNVKGSRFPMLGNLFGTMERARYIFRDTLPALKAIFRAKADPGAALKKPWAFRSAPRVLYGALPKSVKDGPILAHQTRLSELPQLVSWPMDGGAFVTLPQVYSENPAAPGYKNSNLGMYRVQISGNDYEKDREVGLHYQIHRGLGIHHSEAMKKGQPLKVNIFVGGAPAMTLAAVMPLPEGLSELMFAGALAGKRMRMVRNGTGLPMLAEADFCICGTLYGRQQKPEGPFGDHIGYYSLTHDFPVLHVDNVYHREGAIWPFTTVGRPPQEDTIFGGFIHELTEELVPTVFPGVHEVHAVDASGVHPLLLAVGSERYVPYAEERQPQELLTNGMALLGNTQTSLAKYLFIGAREDDSTLSAHDLPSFFRHILERTDMRRDLHFVTKTTIDTLDYSGTGLNAGSKLVWAAAGPAKRRLDSSVPGDLRLAEGFTAPRCFAPGILVVQGPQHTGARGMQDSQLEALADVLGQQLEALDGLPLCVVVDDVDFAARNWENFVWVTFSRSDPATDIYGAHAETQCKHWGTPGPVIIDARLKSFQAPPLDPDPDVEKRVDALAAPGAPLHGIY